MEIESTKTWQECKQNELVNVLPIQTEKNHPEAPQGIFFPLVVYGFWPSHRNPWNCRQTRTTNQRHAGGGGGLSASSPAKRYSYRTAMTKCQGKQEREEENKRNHFTLCDPCHGIYPDICSEVLSGINFDILSDIYHLFSHTIWHFYLVLWYTFWTCLIMFAYILAFHLALYLTNNLTFCLALDPAQSICRSIWSILWRAMSRTFLNVSPACWRARIRFGPGGAQRAVATARFTSCVRQGGGELAWSYA